MRLGLWDVTLGNLDVIISTERSLLKYLIFNFVFESLKRQICFDISTTKQLIVVTQLNKLCIFNGESLINFNLQLLWLKLLFFQLKTNFNLHCKTEKHSNKINMINHVREGGRESEWLIPYAMSSSINPVSFYFVWSNFIC